MKTSLSILLALSSVLATSVSSAATLRCGGLWAGVESIMNVSAVIVTSGDTAPASMSLTVNNAEFRGSMIPAGQGKFAFNVQRVGSSELTLAGSLRFLNTVHQPTTTGFVLHTSDRRIESILTCTESAQ